MLGNTLSFVKFDLRSDSDNKVDLKEFLKYTKKKLNFKLNLDLLPWL